MQRLLRGVIALVLIALPIAAQAQLDIQAYSTQDLFNTPPANGDGAPAGFEPGLGFGLRRHFVTADAASPVDGEGNPIEGEPLEVSYRTRPTELWFLGTTGVGDLELIGINIDRTLRHEFNLTEIGLGDINPNSRIGLIEGGNPESITNTIFMTDPWAHAIHAITFDGEMFDVPQVAGLVGTPELTFFRPRDVDSLDFTGDPLDARALADLGRVLLTTQPELPDVEQMLEDGLLEDGDRFFLKFFDSAAVMALDAESQINPDYGLPTVQGSSGTPETRARIQQIQSPTANPQGQNPVLLAEYLGSTLNGPNDPIAAFYPVGIASTVNQTSSEYFFAVREGGMLDVVYTSFIVAEGSDIPGTPRPLLTNWHLNAQYPLRIQDIAADGEFYLWIRTERVLDADGVQVIPDLYRVNLLSSQWPGPVSTPANPIDRADINADGNYSAQDIVAMNNFLGAGGVPQVDPTLWRRYDVDADNTLTLADTEGVVTQPLFDLDVSAGAPVYGTSGMTYQSSPTYYSAFPTADNIYDVEIVDVNGDRILDLTFLTRDVGGTNVLRFVLGDNTVTPLDQPDVSRFEIPLSFAARNMVWFDYNGDDRIDLAMVSSTDVGQMQIATNHTPLDGPVTLNFGALQDAGPNPLDIASGDFDGNNLQDIVISNNTDEDNLQVFLNRGGEFTHTMRTGQSVPRGLASGNLDASGGADSLAAAISLDSSLQVLASRQGAVLQPIASLLPTLSTPRDIVMGEFSFPNDVSAQRLFDLAAINAATTSDKPVIQFFRNNGNSEFEQMADISIAGFTDVLDGEAGDINLSGYDDIIMVGRNTGIRLYQTDASLRAFFSPAFPTPGVVIPAIPGLSMSDLEIADMDGDGDLDLVVAITGAPRINGLYNGYMIWANRAVYPLNLPEDTPDGGEEEPPLP